MKTISLKYLSVILSFFILVISHSKLNAQIEVDGMAKIAVMNLENSADSVVVVMPDGTLAMRDVSTITEFQILSISNDTIYLTDGGFVKLPPESQLLSISNDTVYLTDGGFVKLPPESQILSISNDTIYLTNGGFVKLPASGGGAGSGWTLDGDTTYTHKHVSIGDSSTTHKFEVFSDSTFISEVNDQSSVAAGDALSISAGSFGAQSFVVDTTGNLTRIEITAQKDGGTTSNLTLEVKTGDDPSMGSSLIVEPFDVTSVGDSLYSVIFAAPIPVTIGDTIVMIIDKTGGDDALWQRSSTDIYAGGIAHLNASGWIPLPTKDHWFHSFIEVQDSFPVPVFAVTHDLKVGVGTSNPSAKLHVLGETQLTGDVAINSNLTVDTDALFVDGTDKQVGIGTNAPGATLDVRGSAVFNEGSTNSDFRIESDGNSSMFFVDASSNEIGIGTSFPSQTFDLIGNMEVNGSAVFNENSTNSDFRIESDINSNMFFVDASANHIGIKTTTPDAPLHIDEEFEALRLDGSGPWLSFYNGANYNGYLQYYEPFNALYLANRNNGPLYFYTSNFAQMTIDGAGEVGINQINPSATFEVKPFGYGGSDGIELQDVGGDRWNINTYSSTNEDLGFWFNGTPRGYLNDATDVAAIDFTSQHRTLPGSNTADDYKDKIGMIVSADGSIYNLDGSYLPSINESLPKVKIPDRAYDKSIYGVISGVENSDAKGENSKRKYSLGLYSTVIDRVDENDYRLIINSGGEGGIWVSNYMVTSKMGIWWSLHRFQELE